ncbi:MAG: hypothetical protein M3Q95_10965 [Bacteroidota bacterium]|nr:hypothetical protein [Bacteroidota bacterium]
MKTFRMLLASFLTLVLIQAVSAAVMTPSVDSVPTIENSKSENSIVKAVLYNGNYIPVVDLPQVEIISTHPGSIISSGILSNGSYLLVVNLPVIEIIGEQTGMRKLPAYVLNGEVIAIADLPLIEIESTLPINHLVIAGNNEGSFIPMVNLPEIVIFPSSSGNYLMAATSFEGKLIPVVDLPLIEINNGFRLFSYPTREYAFEKNNLEWIYISLKNCGITPENKIICEVTSKIKYPLPVLPEPFPLIH